MNKTGQKVVIEFMGMISEKFGAIERYNVELATQLNRKSIKTVFVYNVLPENKDYITLLQKQNADLVELPVNVSFFQKLKSVNVILKKYQPGVVHCHFNFSLIRIIIFLAWLKKIPKRYITIHSMPGEVNFISKTWYFFMTKQTTKLLAVSNGVRNAVIKNLGVPEKSIDVLRLGIDFAVFDKITAKKEDVRKKYQLPQDKKIIGCVAFHQPVKGLDVLLDAVYLLKDKYKRNDFILCQIGYYPGEYADFLQQKVQELKIQNNLIWLGLQDNVPELLHAFDVYCQPSRSEGLGLAIVEAYAAKLPIVATNVGGIPEIVENEITGYLVENEDAEQMADKLNILFEDSELRIKLADNGNRLVKMDYDDTVQVKKVIELYEN